MAAADIEYTLALIKPDAVRSGKAQEIQQLVEMFGFMIIAKKRLQLTHHMAEAFYAEHKGKPFFEGLVEFMTSGPLVALVLSRAGAIREWRELMGPTNVFDARLKAPKSLRALYGSDGTRNATHGSDSPDSAAREIKFFFPTLQLDTVGQSAAAAQEYILDKLQPTLVKALTVLAKEKPTSSKLEAITFLAHWLLENNQNKPQLQVPEELQQQLKQQQATAAARAAAAAAAAEAAAAQQAENSKLVQAKLNTLLGQPGAGETDGAAAAAAADKPANHDEAATKVQAAFRGHQARRQVAGLRAASAGADGGGAASSTGGPGKSAAA